MKVFSHLQCYLGQNTRQLYGHIGAEFPLLNQIQHNALSFFFGLGKTPPIAALRGDSEWIALHADAPPIYGLKILAQSMLTLSKQTSEESFLSGPVRQLIKARITGQLELETSLRRSTQSTKLMSYNANALGYHFLTNGERMYGAQRHWGLKVEVNWFFIGNSSAWQNWSLMQNPTFPQLLAEFQLACGLAVYHSKLNWEDLLSRKKHHTNSDYAGPKISIF